MLSVTCTPVTYTLSVPTRCQSPTLHVISHLYVVSRLHVVSHLNLLARDTAYTRNPCVCVVWMLLFLSADIRLASWAQRVQIDRWLQLRSEGRVPFRILLVQPGKQTELGTFKGFSPGTSLVHLPSIRHTPLSRRHRRRTIPLGCMFRCQGPVLWPVVASLVYPKHRLQR